MRSQTFEPKLHEMNQARARHSGQQCGIVAIDNQVASAMLQMSKTSEHTEKRHVQADLCLGYSQANVVVL